MNYARMPGPGDLPGDSRHPNSPDYVEPEYGEEQAEEDAAKALIANDEVCELVSDMRALLPVLRRIKEGREIPDSFRGAALVALDKAVALQRMFDEKLERRDKQHMLDKQSARLDPTDEFYNSLESIFGVRRKA